jgi:hypothetical protein
MPGGVAAVPEPQSAPTSSSQSNDIARRYKEFLDLLPLTLALAGLPHSEPGRYYGEEQIETRTFAIRHAWKAAKAIVREAVSR